MIEYEEFLKNNTPAKKGSKINIHARLSYFTGWWGKTGQVKIFRSFRSLKNLQKYKL